MSAFGFLFAIFKGTVLLVDHIKDTRYNEECKKYSVEEGRYSYINSKGHRTLYSNGHPCGWDYVNGHQVLRDLKTREIVYDKTAPEEQAFIERSIREAREKGLSTYCIKRWDKNVPIPGELHKKGGIFKDFETGRLLLIRQLNYMYYYIDYETAEIVRKTDWQIEEDEKWSQRFGIDNIDIEKYNAHLEELGSFKWQNSCSIKGDHLYQ